MQLPLAPSSPPRSSIFSNYSFFCIHPLTGMTGKSLQMQWPLTSQLHGSFSQREQLSFLLWIKLHALNPVYHFHKHERFPWRCTMQPQTTDFHFLSLICLFGRVALLAFPLDFFRCGLSSSKSNYPFTSMSGLPDFYRYKIPKRGKYTKLL
jgi:hypothetical protein